MLGNLSAKMVQSRKVVLIEPPAVQLMLSGVALNPVILRYPKYQLQLLRAALERRVDGADVRILDLKGSAGQENQVSRQHYGGMVYEGQPLDFLRVGLPMLAIDEAIEGADVVGVSCSYSMERTSALTILAHVRRRLPSAVILAGGYDVMTSPSLYLQAGASFCVTGEGESAIVEVLTSSAPREIRGVSSMAPDGLRRNGRRAVADLNALDYPTEHQLTDVVYNEHPDGPWPTAVGSRFAVLETSRGCDEACGFCSSTFLSGRYRFWCPSGILGQLQIIRNAGIRSLLIADDNVLYRMLPQYGGDAGRKELLEVFRAMKQMGFAWTFYNGLQFGLFERDGQIDHELIGAMLGTERVSRQVVGCFEAYIPLERFGDENLKSLSKLRSASDQRKIVSTIATSSEAKLNFGFIIGTPADNHSTLTQASEECLAFGDLARTARGPAARLEFLPWCHVPLPGTQDRKKFKASIRYDLDEHPELHSNYVSVIEGDGVQPIGFTLARRDLEAELNGGPTIPARFGQGNHAVRVAS